MTLAAVAEGYVQLVNVYVQCFNFQNIRFAVVETRVFCVCLCLCVCLCVCVYVTFLLCLFLTLYYENYNRSFVFI